MAEFPTAVSPPGGASYSAPLLNFSNFANWSADDPYKLATEKAKLEQIQQQVELSKAFAGGLPTDPQTGQVDYRKAAGILAAKGDIGGAVSLLQQQPPPMSPMFGGGQPQQGGQPQGQPAPQAAPQAQPSSVQARPLPSPGRGPQGDAGTGTVTSLVTDRLPAQNQTTGETIMRIAQVMGVDPNADLTPGQQKRAEGLLKKYAPEIAGRAQTADGSPSFKDRFGGDAGGSLPPSANAGTPSPKVTQQRAPSPATGGAGQGAPAAPLPAPAQPQQPQGPITPQVPLPKGFNDPEQAIQALRTEAVRIGQVPNGQQQAQALNGWADRIEASIKPLSVGASSTLIDPRTGKTLYQGPGAAALAGAGGASSTLDGDAERYRQTGQLPPNMGRGMQGSAEAKAIRARAAEIEIEKGGDPSEWPDKWQKFRAKGVGLSAGERVKANREENLNLILKAADAAIPAALEASKALPRSIYVPLNRLIQKGEVMSSDPRLVEFGMANLQLAEHWARAMNPTGVMRESDRDKALSFLDTAYGNNTYERAVMQLQKQITRERDAVRGGDTILKNGKAPDPGAEGKGASDSTGWVSLPNGTRIREVK